MSAAPPRPGHRVDEIQDGPLKTAGTSSPIFDAMQPAGHVRLWTMPAQCSCPCGPVWEPLPNVCPHSSCACQTNTASEEHRVTGTNPVGENSASSGVAPET